MQCCIGSVHFHIASFPRNVLRGCTIFWQIFKLTMQVDAEDMSSKCKKVANIDSILLGQLRKNLPATIDP